MSVHVRLLFVAALALGTYLLASALYTVSEVEQMIITQFGKPVGDPVTTAGLNLKVPFIQEVNPIDKRVLEWDGSPSDMPTKVKLYITVDLFARWRIQESASGRVLRVHTDHASLQGDHRVRHDTVAVH